MANVSAPFGFRQYSGTGASPTYEQVTFGNGGIAYNAGAIYYGDPVVRQASGDGTLKQAAGSAGGSTVTMAGIFHGCKYLWTATKGTQWSKYWPVSDVATGPQSTIEAYAIKNKTPQFAVQRHSTGLVQTAVGANLDSTIRTCTAANGHSG